MGSDFDFFCIAKDLSTLGLTPDFFTLAEKQGNAFDESIWKKNREDLLKFFPNKNIKVGFKNTNTQI